MSETIFFLIAFAICLFSFLTVFSRDIFHSAIWLALALMNIAALFFYLGAEFLGVVQVLVYIGGIVTLFIFAIKLTAKIGDKSIQQVNRQFLISGVATLIIFCILFKIMVSSPGIVGEPASHPASLKKIGESLLTTYALPFEFISLVLLTAMVGAIVIGKVKR